MRSGERFRPSSEISAGSFCFELTTAAATSFAAHRPEWGCLGFRSLGLTRGRLGGRQLSLSDRHFGFRRYAHDKHATFLGNVGLRTLVDRARSHRIIFGSYLRTVSGTGFPFSSFRQASAPRCTERPPNQVNLVAHAAFVCQDFVIACCQAERDFFDVTTLFHRRYVVFVKLHCDATPFDVISVMPCRAAFEPIFMRPAVNTRFAWSRGLGQHLPRGYRGKSACAQANAFAQVRRFPLAVFAF